MSKVISIIIVTVLPFLTVGIAAQTRAQLDAGSIALKNPAGTASTPSTLKSRNEFELKQSQYISYGAPEYRLGADHQNSSIALRFDEEFNKGIFTSSLKAKDEWSATEKWNYADVHELYVGTKTASTQVSIGRKLETWATWDQEWQQGVFQPRYMKNRMRMEQAGLTGAFVNAHGDHFSATLAGLVFIPDFGTHFHVEDDRFVSKNPWFHPPTDRFQLRAGIGNIHYSVKPPETADVVMHGGAAAKFEFKNKGYLARVSGAYKPMPQFILGFPSEHRFRTGFAADHMDIQINPRVVYDRVVSLDNGYSTRHWSFSGSVAYSNPEDKGAPTDWTSQEVRGATIFSGGIERSLDDTGLHAASVRVGFLKVHGGDARDSGTFAGDETLFERRFQFYEGYLLGLRKDFRVYFINPFETEARVIYDRMQGGGLVALNTGMLLTRNLRAELELDFIGLLTSTGNVSDGFLTTYRANDRVSLGMSYAF